VSNLFPNSVIIAANGSFKPGLAIRLRFAMSGRNDFYYTAFLDDNGMAKVGRDELLRSFDAGRNLFIMDYCDPRAVFTGQITSHVLTGKEITKAIEARGIFKKYPYPNNYFENLKLALTANPDDARVEILIEQVG
jgi:hypothetical protein